VQIALTVQEHLTSAGFTIPHCTFNGGSDAFVDIGNKALGIKALQSITGATPKQTVHCGDRFTKTGK
jgi:IMP and pyridine-specific 5'-nucleotidase